MLGIVGAQLQILRLADRLMGRGVSSVRLVQTGAIDLPDPLKGTP